MWGVRKRYWQSMNLSEGSEVRVEQLSNMLRCWRSRTQLIVIAQAHYFREGPRFILELKKGLKAFRLLYEIWVEWAEVNLTALVYKSLGLFTQFGVLLTLLMISRRFLQLWASSFVFPQSTCDPRQWVIFPLIFLVGIKSENALKNASFQ